MEAQPPKNVIGGVLRACSTDPETGFYRNGRCQTGPRDRGNHVVCAVMTEDFLEFTKQKDNDLMTPRPEMDFPGLEPGDRWCLCAARWQEAVEEGLAPPVVLAATNEAALKMLDLETLKAYALDTAPSEDGSDGGGNA